MSTQNYYSEPLVTLLVQLEVAPLKVIPKVIEQINLHKPHINRITCVLVFIANVFEPGERMVVNCERCLQRRFCYISMSQFSFTKLFYSEEFIISDNCIPIFSSRFLFFFSLFSIFFCTFLSDWGPRDSAASPFVSLFFLPPVAASGGGAIDSLEGFVVVAGAMLVAEESGTSGNSCLSVSIISESESRLNSLENSSRTTA